MFGDIFFKSYVGIFDQGSGTLGFAKSSLADSTVAFTCAGDSCVEPEPTPEPVPVPEEEIVPTEQPEVVEPIDENPVNPVLPDTPSDDTSSNDDDLLWLWIVIGLGVLIVIISIVACYFWRKSKKTTEFNAMLYGQIANDKGTPDKGYSVPGGNLPNHSGDMIEQDIETHPDYSGKGEKRQSMFADHNDIVRETMLGENEQREQWAPSPTAYDQPPADPTPGQ